MSGPKQVRWVALAGFSGLLYAFLYLPLMVVIACSFNRNRFGTGWQGFTLQWHAIALQNPQILAALKNTLLLAAVSTVISTVLGTGLGCALARTRKPARGVISQFLLLSVSAPDIVMAVSLLLFYSLVRQWTGFLQLGMTAMILGHVTFQIPFVALVVRARMRSLEETMDEAAADLGASPWQRFWHVTLPLLRPALLAGALLAFTLSLDDFVVSFFTSGPGSTTVPIYIYSSVKRGLSPEIHALASLIIMAAVLATLGLHWLQQGRGAKGLETGAVSR